MQSPPNYQHQNSDSLVAALIQAGQQLSRIPDCIDTFIKEQHAPGAQHPGLTNTVVLSLMLHESTSERHQALQTGQASLGPWLLSEALALRLMQRPATIETLLYQTADQPSIPDSAPLLATLNELLHQRVTLQTATQTISVFPDLNALDQAIAIALYCWLCTPQHFNICVGRSHQAVEDLDDLDRRNIPALTGVLAGVSIGYEAIPTLLADNNQTLIPTANRLFQLWAGMNPDHPTGLPLQHSVIAASGILKPRTSEHLTLKSDVN